MKSKVAIVVVVCLVVGAIFAISVVQTKPVTKVKVIYHLDWIPGFAHLATYVALDKFWPERGLDVTVVRGAGSGDTILKVGTGVTDFGYGGMDIGVKARAADLLPIKTIFCTNLKNDIGWFYLKGRDAGRGVVDKNDLTTLEGKIAASPEWGTEVLQMPVLFERNGLSPDAVTHVNVDPSVVLAALLSGESDLAVTAIGEESMINEEVRKAGFEGDWFWFKDYGVDVLSDSLWVTEKMIANDPEIVRAFVEGYQEAVVWTLANTKEAADIFVKYLPGYAGQQDGLIAAYKAKASAIMDPGVMEEFGVGYMPPEAALKTVESAYIMYNIEPDFHLDDPTSVFTNEFINPKYVPTAYPW